MLNTFKILAFTFLSCGLLFIGCADKSGYSSRPEVPPTNENPSEAPGETVWTPCAQENGVCLFDGTATVRYGIGDVFVTQTATYAINCSNVAFGIDPVPGVVKICEYSNLLSTLPEDNEGWILCADENKYCNFKGKAEVRYGIYNIYFKRTFKNGTGCNNKVFGDPLVGVVKKCEYRPL